MSKPHRCPHIATTGNICVYCPGGPDSDFEYSTQSYTGCAITRAELKSVVLCVRMTDKIPDFHRTSEALSHIGSPADGNQTSRCRSEPYNHVLFKNSEWPVMQIRADKHEGDQGQVQPICASQGSSGSAEAAGTLSRQGMHLFHFLVFITLSPVTQCMSSTAERGWNGCQSGCRGHGQSQYCRHTVAS